MGRHVDAQQSYVLLSAATRGGYQCKSVIWCDIDILSLVGLVASPRGVMVNVLLHGSMAGQAGVSFRCWR